MNAHSTITACKRRASAPSCNIRCHLQTHEQQTHAISVLMLICGLRASGVGSLVCCADMNQGIYVHLAPEHTASEAVRACHCRCSSTSASSTTSSSACSCFWGQALSSMQRPACRSTPAACEPTSPAHSSSLLSSCTLCIMDMPASFPLVTAIALKWLLVQVRCSCPPSQASAVGKPSACPCQNAACGSATWPLVACRSFPVDSEENPNSQAWPQQIRLKRLHVPAVQAYPVFGGDLHCGGRPEGHVHQLLPPHGAHLILCEALLAQLLQVSPMAEVRLPRRSSLPLLLADF